MEPALPPDGFSTSPLTITLVPVGEPWLRLSRQRYADPLGYGNAPSRFSDPEGRFAVAYFGATAMVCFLETVIRDRANGRLAALPIEQAEIEDWRCAVAAPDRELRLVDLRGEGTIRIGMPSDAVRASDQTLGRIWSAALWGHEAAPDGLLYSSRLNGETNLALYDRAMPAMALVEALPLLERPEMPGIIEALGLAIV